MTLFIFFILFVGFCSLLCNCCVFGAREIGNIVEGLVREPS